MSDGTTPLIQGKEEGYALNLKMLIEETVKDLAELRDNHEKLAMQVLTESHQLALKTLSDAQSAANVHLLNTIKAADQLATATVNSLSNVEANQDTEQATAAFSTIDDIATMLKSLTVVLNTILANMATGRPVTTEPPTAK